MTFYMIIYYRHPAAFPAAPAPRRCPEAVACHTVPYPPPCRHSGSLARGGAKALGFHILDGGGAHIPPALWRGRCQSPRGKGGEVNACPAVRLALRIRERGKLCRRRAGAAKLLKHGLGPGAVDAACARV